MKIPPLKYLRPDNLDGAIGALHEYGDDAKVLAGGQSLIPLMSFRLANPSVLIDVTHVSGLSGVSRENGHVVVGAATRMRAVEQNQEVITAVPVIPPALAHVGHAAIRNRGTAGGSIAHADPAAELPTVLTALGGSVVAQGPGGSREIPADEFFLGALTTALAEDEVLTQVRFPALPAGTGVGVEELARRHGDFAIALAAVAIHIDSAGRIDRAHIGVGGLDQVPRRLSNVEALLVGQEASDEVVASAASQTADAVRPSDDVHASATYRRQVAGVVVARAVKKAIANAREVSQ
jgi:carbon-monoxide dehydrogenase medium subunit